MTLKEKAKKQFSEILSEVMENRTKGDIKELDKQTVTLVDVDVVTLQNKKTGKNDIVPIIVFAEYPDKFYFGGAGFHDFCCDVVDDVECMGELHEKGVRLKIERTRTRNNNDYTKVTFVD